MKLKKEFISYNAGEMSMLIPSGAASWSGLVRGNKTLGVILIAEKLTGMGIKTHGGKDKWSQGTVKSILQNEKYAGNALLQKYYMADFLTTKKITNHGEVPQYFVEDNHEAIIDPALFDRVQDMIEERSRKKGYSGVSIFSSKIQCGCCGGWYGSKVWHSTDKYRRVIWQCNSKFKDKDKSNDKYDDKSKDQTRCQTPHLTEDEIKAAFLRVVNSIIADRKEILRELRAVRDALTGTEVLEKEQKRLAEQMNADADTVQELIAENARVAQDQGEYNVRYNGMVSRFEDTKAKYDEVTAEITKTSIRRRELEQFIQAVRKLPEVVAEFDEALWGSLVEYVTVNGKDDIVFTMASGVEIKA